MFATDSIKKKKKIAFILSKKKLIPVQANELVTDGQHKHLLSLQ